MKIYRDMKSSLGSEEQRLACMSIMAANARHSCKSTSHSPKDPLFSELSEQELNFIAERAVVLHFEAGLLVFSAGEACPDLWIIETGKVRIYKSSPNVREQVLAIEGPGSSVAEVPAFDEGKYPTSAASVNEAKLLFISKEDF
jgi:CRP-like cAMP-binding protein